MGTISSAFTMMSSALDADQAALNVVANNVANANATGYTVETPNWRENRPISINGIESGDGASVTGSTSQRDSVLLQRLDQQQQLASASSSRLSAFNTIQALFTPDSGSASASAGDIGSDITKFFSSFSSLETNPTDNSLREQVLSSASTLAGDISNAASSLNSQRSALDQEAAGAVSQVNALTSDLAQLNQQIQSTSPNGDAGTLEDQRQQDLSQLSQLIGINQIKTDNNGLEITTTAGQLLVSENSSVQMTSGKVDGVTHFYLGTTDVTSQLAAGGGSLGGTLTVRDPGISGVLSIPDVLTSLNQLAFSISTSVNGLNNAGADLDGDTSNAGNIFFEPAQLAGSAASMSVVMTDPSHIAAAGHLAGTGDSSNAALMSNLGSQPSVDGQSPIDYYSNFVTTLGSTVSSVQTENTAHNASVMQLQTQNDALSGVNLNDEASAMTTLERSYQAASQVFTMLNTIMASVLNLGDSTAVS